MTTSATRLYAVFGPGWGSQYLDPANQAHLGSGHIAYRGTSLSAARRALARERASLRRLRRRPDMRDVADTYRIYAHQDDGWCVLE